MSIIRRNNDRDELDLAALFSYILKRLWLIILCGALAAGCIGYGLYRFQPLEYKASVRMYINNMIDTEDLENITYSDLTASITLAETYLTIIDSDTVFDEVLKEADLSYTRKEMSQIVTYSAIESTAIILIEAVSEDPEEAALIANTYADVAQDKLTDIVEGSSVKILDQAAVPDEAEPRGIVKMAALGFLLGAFLAAVFILIHALQQKNVRSVEDLEYFEEPVLGRIPEQYKAAGRRAPRKKTAPATVDFFLILNDKTPFAVREAYNTLRTNLVYSFSGKRCKTILVTSTLEHEGKTSTSINLAKSLAESGYKVLLMDGDLRRGSIAKSLRIKNNPGVSDYLAGMCEPKDMVQPFTENLSVFAAGTTPPNPNSLLSSAEMKKLIEAVNKLYDYVIIDAPPAGPVSDPVVLAKLCTGYVVVVRKNASRRDDISLCLKEMKVSGVPMLGFVFTCDSRGSEYKAYKNYGNY